MTHSLAANNRPWLIYGATGATGRLVLEEALRRGHRPILAGRDAGALRALAEPHRLAWAAVRLDGRPALEKLVARASRVLHVAGPFRITTPPMLDACLAAGTPYLDVSGELEVVSATLERDSAAKSTGIPIIAGAGFAVTAGDCLALHVARRRPAAKRLWLGLDAQNGQKSPAALLSTLDVIGAGGAWVTDGRIRRGAAGHRSRTVTLGGRAQTFVAAPVADVVAALRGTGIPEIVAGVPAPRLVAPLLRWLAPLLQRVARSQTLRRFAERRAARKGSPGVAARPSNLRSLAWAEASDDQGSSSALLEMGEGYHFAACAAVRAAEGLARCAPGAFTPGAAFGPDFVLELEGVTRRDLASLTEPGA
jgi:short subunit dehydrogenase-like uncharacterized protein